MKKSEIIKDMRTLTGCGATISWNKISEYMKIDRNDPEQREELTAGVPFIPSGRGKEYFVPDIAEKIKDRFASQ